MQNPKINHAVQTWNIFITWTMNMTVSIKGHYQGQLHFIQTYNYCNQYTMT